MCVDESRQDEPAGQIERLPARVVVQRLTGDPHPDELTAPDWCLDKTATLTRTAIMRGRDRLIWVDLRAMLNGDLAYNIRMKKGDIVFIPDSSETAVYVLGDLHDWWIGDDQLDDPFAARIATALRGVTDAGARLHVMQGNRDFLYGPRFERATGAALLPEQLVVDANGVPTVLLHGDELCTSDLDYQRYRARMRTPETRRRLLALPAFVRRWIARSLPAAKAIASSQPTSRHGSLMRSRIIGLVTRSACVA